VVSACAQTPTLAAFRASEAANTAAIYTTLAGKSFPKPLISAQFWPMTDIYCGYAQASGNCLFSLTEAENVITTMCPVVNGTITPIIDNLQVNIDLWNWTANTTQAIAHRTEFDALFNPSTGFFVTACPGVTLTLNPGFTTGNLNAVCATLASTPNPMTGPANLVTCMSAVATWLTISATNYSPYGYLAKQYGSELLYFAVMHEPASANGNPAYAWANTNQSAWETFITSMATVVHAQCSGCSVGMAFDRFESGFYSVMASATGVQAVGVDDYTSDCAAPTSSCGALLTLAGNVISSGRKLYVSELGQPAWVPTGDTQTAGNSYEDIGNCVWMQNDFTREAMVVKYLLWSSQGAASISNYYTTAQVTTCVYGGINNGYDKQTSLTWANTFATAASSSATTNMLQFFTTLYSWPFYAVSPGVALGI